MVFEALWVDWYLGMEDFADASGTRFGCLSTTARRATGDTITLASIVADVADPNVLAPAVDQYNETTSGGQVNHYPIRINLTDENGNGVLVATDRMFLIAGAVAPTLVASTTAKIGYRQVPIGSIEYAGIVQSQISGTS